MPRIDISISDILGYLGNRVRPLKEGEQVFKAGHIISCGVDANQPNVIKSFCLQTSALTKTPHEISITINNANFTCQCSCKAGMSGFCKHVLGTLIYINRNEDLDFVSCTDIKQKWGKEKKGLQEVYAATPFSSFCHPTIKKNLIFRQMKI